MQSARIAEKSEYKTLYQHMKRDFPASERPPYAAVRRNLEKKAYTALFFLEEEKITGYAVVTAPEGSTFALVNYFAVLPEYRGEGYGGAFLQLLKRHFSDRIFILEVEARAAAKDEEEKTLRERRIRFYERAGFSILPGVRARIFGVEMELMADAKEELGDAREIMHALYAPSLPPLFLRKIEVLDKA